ncbi:MAG: bifunctional phosphopantothenoylcysteine decarboxylase/phosphopantothenate--cysteine ligase CoaBC [Candidatus Hydrogenedentes bacterium]|nr:bifunctional phosphopantothenoylcysteine decarboxylase/phosphopantothenate--cysteine ligase CoaBC [Candidatus Hydrogenedentota bacterium]
MRKRSATKEVVLGVTGSIAAYKACEIASRLVEHGILVTPVLTYSATKLVGAATFEAITGRRAILGMFDAAQNPEVEHIAVATRASLFLIAPATANILAKAAHGIADDWLSTALLATQAPILFAPAMNTNMYQHPATQANIKLLEERGAHFVGPESGRLACKTVGPGRLIEPQAVLEAAMTLLGDKDDALAGRHVLITSGGTREALDPVRFIGNHSSGRMGRALAMEALERGCRVTVVTGPAAVTLPHGAMVERVESAQQMAEAVKRLAPHADVIIGAAAVADYRPEHSLATKHKRGGEPMTVTLVENEDIIAAAGKAKPPSQVVVGFAAETGHIRDHAQEKLEKKNLDLILACEVGSETSGFGVDTLRATLLGRDGAANDLGLVSKEEVAQRIFDSVATLIRSNPGR